MSEEEERKIWRWEDWGGKRTVEDIAMVNDKKEGKSG